VAKSLKASLADQGMGAWAMRLGADGDHLFAFDEAEADGFPPDLAADQFYFADKDSSADAWPLPASPQLAQNAATEAGLVAADGPTDAFSLGDTLLFNLPATVGISPTDAAQGITVPEFVFAAAAEGTDDAFVLAVSALAGSDAPAPLDQLAAELSHILAEAQALSPLDPKSPPGGWIIENGVAVFVDDIMAYRANAHPDHLVTFSGAIVDA
jgi:hypothetical protein